jgi:hypothetical protein
MVSGNDHGTGQDVQCRWNNGCKCRLARSKENRPCQRERLKFFDEYKGLGLAPAPAVIRYTPRHNHPLQPRLPIIAARAGVGENHFTGCTLRTAAGIANRRRGCPTPLDSAADAHMRAKGGGLTRQTFNA